MSHMLGCILIFQSVPGLTTPSLVKICGTATNITLLSTMVAFRKSRGDVGRRERLRATIGKTPEHSE
eukprot:12934350-Prorocentrum_lima.AAC.1